MPGGVVVNGNPTHYPDVYITPEFANLQGRQSGTGILAIIGSLPFLEKGVAYLSTSQTAFELLAPRDPTLLKISNIVWNPSEDPRVPGAPAGIYLMNVDTTTAAIGYIQDATPANAIKLTSRIWGPRGNVTRFTLIDNATLGGTDVTIMNSGVTLDSFRVPDDDNVIALTYLNPETAFPGAAPKTAYGFAGAGVGTGTGDVLAAKSGSSILIAFTLTLPVATYADVTVLTHKSWEPRGPINGTIGVGTSVGAVLSAGSVVYLITGVNGSTGVVTYERVLRTVGEALAGTPGISTISWSSIDNVIVYTSATAAAGTSIVSAALAGTPGTAAGTLTGTLAFAGNNFASLNAAGGQTYATDVITYVNAFAGDGFTASTGSTTAGTTLVASLDAHTAGSMIGGESLGATQYRMVEAINAQSVLVTATQLLQTAIPAAVTALVIPLSGGTVSAGGALEYTTGLSELSWYDINTVVPLSNSNVIHALVEAHTEYMGGVGANERNAWFGTAAGETFVAATARVVAVNNFRCSFAFEEADIVQYNGATERMEPYWYALMLAAMENGNRRVPLTHKKPRVQAVYRHSALSTREALDACIAAGLVVTTSPPAEGLRIERWVTSHLENNDAARTEGSAVDSSFDICRLVRAALRPLIGTAGTTSAGGVIGSIVRNTLNQAVTDGVIGSWIADSLVISQFADRWDVRFTFSPTYPINFILVTPVVQVPTTTTI